MKLFRRVVILSHRYLGIGLSLLIAVWFASGIVMMYAGGMPRLTPELRLERLAPLDVNSVRLTPAEAVEQAGLTNPGRMLLLSVLDRPAYRLGAGGGTITVFADTGDLLDEISLEQARGIAARFLDIPAERVRHVATLEDDVDQWTLLQSRQLPLYKFAADDDAASEVYISPYSGEIAMLTTRVSRALAWVGVIPHWLYFRALRTNQPLWYDIVVWTSAIACVIALLGLILGVIQFRRTKPFRLAAAIPYSGWMRWHYITGAVFGVFTLTWAFSGLLSMEPFAWTQATGLEVDREVLTGGPLEASRYPAMDPARWNQLSGGRPIKEIEFARIQDEHYYVVRHSPMTTELGRRERLHQPYPVGGRVAPDRMLVSASTLEARREPFSAESLVARLRTAMPDIPIVGHELLTEYDSYYYSRRQQTPLPVLRVKFADPSETWVYIDPEMSQVLAEIHRLARVERWLYNGLHSLDFAFWYNSVAWDVAVIVLCLGGFASSSIGVLLGIRRIRRGVTRATRQVRGASTAVHEAPNVAYRSTP